MAMEPYVGSVGAQQLLMELRQTCVALDAMRLEALMVALRAHLSRRANWTRALERLERFGRGDDAAEIQTLKARLEADAVIIALLQRLHVRGTVANELGSIEGSSLMVEVFDAEGKPVSDARVVLSQTPGKAAPVKMEAADRTQGVYAFEARAADDKPMYLRVLDEEGRTLAVLDDPVVFEENIVLREVRLTAAPAKAPRTPATPRKATVKKRTPAKTKATKGKKATTRTSKKKPKE
ncbi:MAG: hypothetical protein RIT81_16510 [Deltaproteobacteria bacterium]